jgi:hypothetical protein
MIITEVGPAHVPVKILGLDVQSENVSQQDAQRNRDFLYELWRDVGTLGVNRQLTQF